jgi:hypothetical protein
MRYAILTLAALLAACGADSLAPSAPPLVTLSVSQPTVRVGDTFSVRADFAVALTSRDHIEWISAHSGLRVLIPTVSHRWSELELYAEQATGEWPVCLRVRGETFCQLVQVLP